MRKFPITVYESAIKRFNITLHYINVTLNYRYEKKIGNPLIRSYRGSRLTKIPWN